MPRLRSSLAAPGSARLVGALVALTGVILLVFGVVALGRGEDGSTGAAPAPPATSPATSAVPSATPSATPSPTASPTPSPSLEPTPTGGTGVGSEPARTTAAPPPRTRPAAPRAPLTVLNNSTIAGLADRAAGDAQARGWQVAQVGNFAGRLPATTVYYTPGNAAQEAAARQLAREFPQVAQVLPRYAGLPPTPTGIVLVVTQNW